MTELSLILYRNSRDIILLLLPILFLGRIAVNIFYNEFHDVGESFKTLVICCVMLGAFDFFLPFLVELPRHVLNYTVQNGIAPTNDKLLSKLADGQLKNVMLNSTFSGLTILFKILEAGVNLVVNLIFIILAIISPIIIVLSIMMNVGIGAKLLIGLYVILATWNIGIAGIEVAVYKLIESDDGSMAFVLMLLSGFFKLLIGFINTYSILRTPLGAGMTSGLSNLKSGISSSFGSSSKSGKGFESQDSALNPLEKASLTNPNVSTDDKISALMNNPESKKMAQIQALNSEAQKRNFNEARSELGLNNKPYKYSSQSSGPELGAIANKSAAKFLGVSLDNYEKTNNAAFSDNEPIVRAPADYQLNLNDDKQNNSEGRIVENGTITDVTGNMYNGSTYKSNASARIAHSQDTENTSRMSETQRINSANRSQELANNDFKAQNTGGSGNGNHEYAGHFAKRHQIAADNFRKSIPTESHEAKRLIQPFEADHLENHFEQPKPRKALKL